MPTQSHTAEFDAALKAHFLALPDPVRNAILSVDIEKRLRELSGTHKLFLNQWEVLENEVLLALLGIKDANNLPSVIQESFSLSPEEASALAKDISRAIFEPIRAEMERTLGAPQAKEETHTDIENIRVAALAEEKTQLLAEHGLSPSETTQKVFTPSPQAPQAGTVVTVKTEIPESMRTGTSAERKVIENDLYREQL